MVATRQFAIGGPTARMPRACLRLVAKGQRRGPGNHLLHVKMAVRPNSGHVTSLAPLCVFRLGARKGVASFASRDAAVVRLGARASG